MTAKASWIDRLDAFLARLDVKSVEAELPLRAGILLTILRSVASLCVLYAIVAVAFGIKSYFFPWDLLEMVAALGLCLWFRARGRVSTACTLVLAVLSHPLSFLAGTYGLRSAAPALLIPTILLCGLLVGRRMVYGWTAICWAVLIWVSAMRGLAGSWGVLAAWLGIYAATGYLVSMFSVHLERSVAISRKAEEAERSAVLAERARAARDLHDALAQGFTAVVVQLNAAEQALNLGSVEAIGHIRLARELARKGLSSARDSVLALRRFEGLGLFQSLERLAKSILEPAGLEYSIDDRLLAEPTERTAEAFAAIAGEAFTNTVRHAHAKSVHVRITSAEDRLSLEIQDNGMGFDPTKSEGYGLAAMQERAASIGGSLRIDSSPGRATTLQIDAPLRGADE